MTDLSQLEGGSRSERLDRALHALLGQTPEIEAAAVVSFDGLPMASALPPSMDEDRVAAMSAALLSLGERAAQGLGRGELSQVYIEGDSGTVFLVSADDEAVLVAVAAKGAKVGLMLFEVRRAAVAVAEVLRADEPAAVAEPVAYEVPAQPVAEPVLAPVADLPVEPAPVHAVPSSASTDSYASPVGSPLAVADDSWTSSYAPTGTVMPGSPALPPTWS